MPSRKIPKDHHKARSLRDAERAMEYDDDHSDSDGDVRPLGRRRSSQRSSTRPKASTKAPSPLYNLLCLFFRSIMVLCLLASVIFLCLLAIDEYFRIEVCHAVSPMGHSRMCYLLNVKNNTLETLEMIHDLSEPYAPGLLRNSAARSASPALSHLPKPDAYTRCLVTILLQAPA